MKFPKYTTKSIEETFQALKSSKNGLSQKEAEERLKVYGLNEIKIKEITAFDILIKQLKSPSFYLLFTAAIISILVGEITDGLVILIFVFINIFLGFFQESRAAKTASILKHYLPRKIQVLRNGQTKEISQELLVPGDIVILEAGDIVPADLRIIESKDLLLDESILTGESVPVSKKFQALPEEAKEIFKAQNIAFAGTSVLGGKAKGVIIGTGKNTVMGEVAKLTLETNRQSANQKNLLNIWQLILKIVLLTITIVFIANLIIKGKENFFDFLIFSIALVVSIVPEALPAVITFAFSQGALKLAKKKVVVKRLSAIEDLGDIEVLCADKTGTLTENKLRLEKIYAKDKEKCLLYGLLASDYIIKKEVKSIKNPFDLALFEKASSAIHQDVKKIKLISEIPFDPYRLKSSVLVNLDGKKLLIVKGAPEVILKDSLIIEDDLKKEKILEEIKKEGKEGKRVLAVAFKNFDKDEFTKADEKNLTFVGYFSFEDPLKKTAKKTIKVAKKLGIQIKILTGDSKEVAGKVAKDVGLIKNSNKVILGETLETMEESDFKKTCEEFSVFARVSPQMKFKIIQTLQKKYEVGFLGEGINDAPALKVANVAISVREATDISREVSDIVLLKKDLRVIVDGIEEGRKIFANLNKYMKCTLSSNIGNFYSIAAVSLILPYLPMLPSQILLVNLLSDFPLIAIASDNVDIEELRRPKFYQLNRMVLLIILLALLSTIFDFIFFGIFHNSEPAMLQTLWFVESIVSEIILIFSIRTSKFFLKAKFPSLPLFLLSLVCIGTTIILPFTYFGQKTFHFIAPSLHDLLIVLCLLFSYFILSEIVKLIYFKHWSFLKKK